MAVTLYAPGIKRWMTIFTKWLTSGRRRAVDTRHEKELSVPHWLCPAQEV